MDFSCKAVLAIVVCTAVFRISPGQELVTNCSSSRYTYGVPGDVLCQLARSYYDSSCGIRPPRVQFVLYSPAGARSTYCAVDFSPFPSAGTPETANCPSCSCSSDATGSEYTLTFTPDSTVHYNGRFQCEVSCFSGTPTEDHSSCNPIPLPPPTTSTTKPESTSTATPAPPTTPQVCECYCECCDEWVKVVIPVVLVTVFSLFCVTILIIIDFNQQVWLFDDMDTWTFPKKLRVVVLYVLFIPGLVYIIIDAVRRKWLFDATRVKVWHVVLIVVCTFIPEFMVVYVICAAIFKTWPFEEDKGKAWEILVFVIGFMLCCVWVIYMTVGGICGFWPLIKCKCTCVCTGVTEKSDESTEAWEIAVFVIGLIFIVGWIVYFIVCFHCKWWPFCRDRTSAGEAVEMGGGTSPNRIGGDKPSQPNGARASGRPSDVASSPPEKESKKPKNSESEHTYTGLGSKKSKPDTVPEVQLSKLRDTSSPSASESSANHEGGRHLPQPKTKLTPVERMSRELPEPANATQTPREPLPPIRSK